MLRAVAWIRRKRGGWLVCWRDERRKERSKYVHTRDAAEALKAELDREATARRVLSTVPGIPGWDDPGRTLDATEPTYALGNYLSAIVRGNRELRETTREMYLRNIRVHIDGTSLGRADIRSISPEMLTEVLGSAERRPRRAREHRAAAQSGVPAGRPNRPAGLQPAGASARRPQAVCPRAPAGPPANGR